MVCRKYNWLLMLIVLHIWRLMYGISRIKTSNNRNESKLSKALSMFPFFSFLCLNLFNYVFEVISYTNTTKPIAKFSKDGLRVRNLNWNSLCVDLNPPASLQFPYLKTWHNLLLFGWELGKSATDKCFYCYLFTYTYYFTWIIQYSFPCSKLRFRLL